MSNTHLWGPFVRNKTNKTTYDLLDYKHNLLVRNFHVNFIPTFHGIFGEIYLLRNVIGGHESIPACLPIVIRLPSNSVAQQGYKVGHEIYRAVAVIPARALNSQVHRHLYLLNMEIVLIPRNRKMSSIL